MNHVYLHQLSDSRDDYTIDWEFSGEGTLNVFKIISQDTLEFKQLGAQNSATFIRRKVKY